MPVLTLLDLVVEEYGRFGADALAEEWAAISRLPSVWVYRHQTEGTLRFAGVSVTPGMQQVLGVRPVGRFENPDPGVAS